MSALAAVVRGVRATVGTVVGLRAYGGSAVGRSRGRPLPRSRRRTLATRAGALLGLVSAVGIGYGAVTSSAFGLGATELPHLAWTPHEALAATIQVKPGTNVFRIATGPIEDRIRALPGVATAHVRVALPDRLVVEVAERKPVLAWRVGESLFLVDASGRVFTLASADAVAAAHLAIVADTRAASATRIFVGGSLDPIDLDAATRLGSLVPRDVGSVAKGLAVSATDENGFVVRSVPDDWTAIFGFYTPTHRTTELIPGQVRLLRSLLDGHEGIVARIILADDRNGTYVPKPSAKVAP